MSDEHTGLQAAEARLDQIQLVLDDVRRVVVGAEKAQAAADRARSAFPKIGLAVLALAILGTTVVALRRRRRRSGHVRYSSDPLTVQGEAT